MNFVITLDFIESDHLNMMADVVHDIEIVVEIDR